MILVPAESTIHPSITNPEHYAAKKVSDELTNITRKKINDNNSAKENWEKYVTKLQKLIFLAEELKKPMKVIFQLDESQSNANENTIDNLNTTNNFDEHLETSKKNINTTNNFDEQFETSSDNESSMSNSQPLKTVVKRISSNKSILIKNKKRKRGPNDIKLIKKIRHSYKQRKNSERLRRSLLQSKTNNSSILGKRKLSPSIEYIPNKRGKNPNRLLAAIWKSPGKRIYSNISTNQSLRREQPVNLAHNKNKNVGKLRTLKRPGNILTGKRHSLIKKRRLDTSSVISLLRKRAKVPLQPVSDRAAKRRKIDYNLVGKNWKPFNFNY